MTEKAVTNKYSDEDIKLFDYLIGMVIGAVLGFIVSKVYQAWAILYRETHYDPNKSMGWRTDMPPTWVFATENPTIFHAVIMILFILLAGLCTFYLRERWKRRPEGINNQD
jgi:hypothetical protein